MGLLPLSNRQGQHQAFNTKYVWITSGVFYPLTLVDSALVQ